MNQRDRDELHARWRTALLKLASVVELTKEMLDMDAETDATVAQALITIDAAHIVFVESYHRMADAVLDQKK